MPTTAALLAFLLASLVVVVIPGPSVVYVMARGISQGRSAALLSVVGLELGALVHLLATAVGLGTLVAAWPELLAGMRWAGAGYLVWLAVRELRASCSSVQPVALRPAGRWRLVRDGLVIDVLNPGTALFFLAFLPQFVDPARGPVVVQIMLLGLCFLLLASANDAVYALVSGALAAGQGRRWLARRQVQVATACVYLALAAVAVLVHT